MNIFLCHSGSRSHQVAKALHHFLPRVIHAVKPFISDENIKKGKRWMDQISQNLEETSIGIVCLTPDNLDSPWIHFEVGALFKGSGESHVCPYLFNLNESDVVSPFAEFQMTLATLEDTYRLVQQLNENLGEHAIPFDVLKDGFEAHWPAFLKMLEAIPATLPEHAAPKRKEGEILDEILSLARQINKRDQAGPLKSPEQAQVLPIFASSRTNIWDAKEERAKGDRYSGGVIISPPPIDPSIQEESTDGIFSSPGEILTQKARKKYKTGKKEKRES